MSLQRENVQSLNATAQVSPLAAIDSRLRLSTVEGAATLTEHQQFLQRWATNATSNWVVSDETDLQDLEALLSSGRVTAGTAMGDHSLQQYYRTLYSSSSPVLDFKQFEQCLNTSMNILDEPGDRPIYMMSDLMLEVIINARRCAALKRLFRAWVFCFHAEKFDTQGDSMYHTTDWLPTNSSPVTLTPFVNALFQAEGMDRMVSVMSNVMLCAMLSRRWVLIETIADWHEAAFCRNQMTCTLYPTQSTVQLSGVAA